MPNNIYMPALSPTMTEGSLTKWLVKVGDKIKAGDILAEIETDKATMEVEAVDEGIITNLIFEEGTESIPINTVIAILDGKNNKIESVVKSNNDNSSKINKSNKSKDSPEFISKQDSNNDTLKIKEKNLKRNYLASPLAKSLAKEKNIDLKSMSGSGPKGRIIKRDFENLESKSFKSTKNEDNIIIPSSIRKIIAEKTTLTKQNVPHFYLKIDSNVGKLIKMRKKINQSLDVKISINDILIKALAEAQKLNPLTNISWMDGKMIKNNSIDVSVAVAIEEGLVTPIIKNADKKGLKEIAIEIKQLVEKSKTGKLLPDEYNGGSISISNLGMFGISEFSAIINPPQSSILAVGEIKKVPGIENNEIKPVHILKSTLSADHRVLDGAVAGKLLKDFNDIIEDPFSLWLKSDDMEII